MMFVCKNANVEDIEEAVQKLGVLFSDDPLFEGDDAVARANLCTWCDIEEQYDELKQAVDRLAADEERRRNQQQVGLKRAKTGAMLEPIELDRIEKTIARADLSNLMRRQPVCAIQAGAPPQMVFTELFISIQDMQRALAPNVNIASSRWLFQHLTEFLDRRMLALLRNYEDTSISTHFSLNLNVATLLTQDFLGFDSGLKAGARGTVVIEMSMVDVFADLGSFVFARDFVRERGYRLCLDGLTHMVLPYIDRDRLGIDLIKLQWSPEMAEDPGGKRREDLAAQVKRLGPARTIMSRCDSPDAIEVGHSIGINYFQGRHIDAVIAEEKAKSSSSMTMKQALGKPGVR